MQHLTLVVFPSALATSISLPLEMLNAASETARSKNRHRPALQLAVTSSHTGPIETAGGLQLIVTETFDSIEQSDLIILPSLWRNPLQTLRQQRKLLPWLKKMSSQGSVICAVGSSSYLLAEAGLLDNKPATTHWYYCTHFAKRYPQVDLKHQYLITQAENIYCAASVNSGADLTIHLIGLFYGQDIARIVEAQFSPEIRRPFEDHAYAQFDSDIHQDETIILAQEWLREHSNETVQLTTLAEKLGLSMRSFNRRFKQATGITAGKYLQNQRLDSARELLRTSNLSINEVAAQSGYQDGSYFCARFKKTMGKTPLAYRKSVRGKLFKVL